MWALASRLVVSVVVAVELAFSASSKMRMPDSWVAYGLRGRQRCVSSRMTCSTVGSMQVVVDVEPPFFPICFSQTDGDGVRPLFYDVRRERPRSPAGASRRRLDTTPSAERRLP